MTVPLPRSSPRAARRVKIAEREVRIIESKSELLTTLGASGVKSAPVDVRGFVLKWRRGQSRANPSLDPNSRETGRLDLPA